MKNRQLMRLNKVLHKGVVKTVDCIAIGHVSFMEDIPRENGARNYGKWIDLDEVEFIPITDDELRSIGILYDTFNDCYTFSMNGETVYYIHRDKDKEGLFIVGFSEYPVRFVHELQNVLFWEFNFIINEK